MLKSILKVSGVKELEKQEQQKINGGRVQCAPFGVCTEYGLQCAEKKCQILPF